MTGQEGGETGVDDEHAMAWSENTGAVIMGRNMFGPVRGGWGDESWHGWWGDDPPYHVPVFVLTHHAREPVEMEGGTTFHFVTDGIEAALERARGRRRGAGRQHRRRRRGAAAVPPGRPGRRVPAARRARPARRRRAPVRGHGRRPDRLRDRRAGQLAGRRALRVPAELGRSHDPAGPVPCAAVASAPIIEAEGLRKAYGETIAFAGVDLDRTGGHGPRAARPERRRQDDARADPRDAADPGRGPAASTGHRRRRAARRTHAGCSGSPASTPRSTSR